MSYLTLGITGADAAYGKKDWVIQLVTWKNAAWTKYGAYAPPSATPGMAEKTPKITWQEALAHTKELQKLLPEAHEYALSTPIFFAGESGAAKQYFSAENRWLAFTMRFSLDSLQSSGGAFVPVQLAYNYWDEFQRIAMNVNAIWGIDTAWDTFKQSLPDAPKMPGIPQWVWWMMYGMGGLWALSMLPKKRK